MDTLQKNKMPRIFDTSDGQQLRINMIGSFLKKKFGKKIIKLSLDGGFTCPNRDGSKGLGGCLFCSSRGSGDRASRFEGGDASAIRAALDSQIALLSDKWPDGEYIAYFQSNTSTYAPADELRDKFRAALSHPSVKGLAIATRTDCLPDDVLNLLEELNRETFLWVELGLQTTHETTAKAMNLCHTLSDYDRAIRELGSRNIPVVTHLILGLPGESREMMMESVRYACRESESGRIFGIKLHMLNLVKGSLMEKTMPDYVSFETMEDYIDTLIEALEIIPPEITVHRISGDAPREILISPSWSYRKRTILNGIHKEMQKRNTWQGKALD
ncbi:MAG: TIGR01212 family radical SAM protein [Clostridiales bacterium]|nr:TIGR01212 family radical SAM protein [Clostridiales bacterium]MDD7035614.1 TIGR01212 family radical SAM protein [Bacillota bacterium]MDY2920235.1 TIGR01212 family radical SAM protein [Lentihominibacter sp.]